MALLFGGESRSGDYLSGTWLPNAAPRSTEACWRDADGMSYFDEDGERNSGGRWSGCGGAARPTCNLVTHMVALRNYLRRGHSGVSGGVGIGVGF